MAAPNAAPARRRPLLPPCGARKARADAAPPPPPPPPAAVADDADDAPLVELSRRRSAQVWRSPALLRAARLARRRIDALFAEPRTLDTRRLLDAFYVQDRYNLLRTQPGALLGDDAAAAIVDALVEFGEDELGLRAITPPWISFYLDGMGQELHVDAFQGPLAFVLPLSWWGDESDGDDDEEEEEEEEEDGDDAGALVRRPRVFVGGETAILRHGALRYWDGAAEEAAGAAGGAAAATATTTATTSAATVDLSGGSFAPQQGRELDCLFARVPPRFGRLLVFDGRMPHGVRPVRCPTADPRDARVALHAWFAPPEGPYFSGALAGDEGEGEGEGVGAGAGEQGRASASSSSTAQQRKKAAAALDAAVRALVRELAEDCPPASGLLTARAAVCGKTGRVRGPVAWLADTLVVSPAACADGGITEGEARALVQHVVAQRLSAVAFPPAKGGRDSTVTVPLLFD